MKTVLWMCVLLCCFLQVSGKEIRFYADKTSRPTDVRNISVPAGSSVTFKATGPRCVWGDWLKDTDIFVHFNNGSCSFTLEPPQEEDRPVCRSFRGLHIITFPVFKPTDSGRWMYRGSCAEYTALYSDAYEINITKESQSNSTSTSSTTPRRLTTTTTEPVNTDQMTPSSPGEVTTGVQTMSEDADTSPGVWTSLLLSAVGAAIGVFISTIVVKMVAFIAKKRNRKGVEDVEPYDIPRLAQDGDVRVEDGHYTYIPNTRE